MKTPPTRQAKMEALTLSEQILQDIELGQTTLENIFLKTSRLTRLLNDAVMQHAINYELSGYPANPDGLPEDLFKLASFANREYKQKKDGRITSYCYLESIAVIDAELKTNQFQLSVAGDPNISVVSSNPHQIIPIPQGNATERSELNKKISELSKKLAQRRAFIHKYVLKINLELKFSGIADDIFTRLRGRVDTYIGDTLAPAIEKLSSIYENLKSDNCEDWANAVHGCRRVLQALADNVFPATEVPRRKGKKEIKLEKKNYINRLMAYIEDSSDSKKFEEVVGAHLNYIGARLDSLYGAGSKGTHEEIISQQEADRYVIYTYLLVGDILSLKRLSKA
jgi:hypothetical protein